MKTIIFIMVALFISSCEKKSDGSEKYDGWHLFSHNFSNNTCDDITECTYRWGCSYLINRDEDWRPCISDDSSVIFDYKYDCRPFYSDFCSKHHKGGNAYCNSTDGRCYLNPILCEEDSQCPMYFFCLDGNCVETVRDYLDPDKGGTEFCVKPQKCDVDSDCFYWENCQHNPSYPEEKGQCQSNYCDFDSSKNYFWDQCGVSSYCAEGTSYGLSIPIDDPNWPTKPDQTWDHPGNCVETTLCDTNQDCTNPGMPVCDQNRKLCLPTDYPQ